MVGVGTIDHDQDRAHDQKKNPSRIAIKTKHGRYDLIRYVGTIDQDQDRAKMTKNPFRNQTKQYLDQDQDRSR